MQERKNEARLSSPGGSPRVGGGVETINVGGTPPRRSSHQFPFFLFFFIFLFFPNRGRLKPRLQLPFLFHTVKAKKPQLWNWQAGRKKPKNLCFFGFFLSPSLLFSCPFLLQRKKERKKRNFTISEKKMGWWEAEIIHACACFNFETALLHLQLDLTQQLKSIYYFKFLTWN